MERLAEDSELTWRNGWSSGPNGLRGWPLDANRILPPVLYPNPVYCAGANYTDHVQRWRKPSTFLTTLIRTEQARRAWPLHQGGAAKSDSVMARMCPSGVLEKRD